jgi:tetratricopeptide (TPR) repeat protein
MKKRIFGSINGGIVLAALFVLSLLVVFAARAQAPAPDPAIAIAQAQALYDQEKFKESNDVLMALLKTNPNHPDICWKISQNFYEQGERMDIKKNKDAKMKMYQQAEQWAAKGLKQNPNLADNSFWMAVALSQQAQTRGIASTLMNDRTLAKRIETYYLKAAGAKEFHFKTANSNTVASANFALGQFYRKIPDSAIVGMLMGTRGDIEKSVKYARVSVKMFPNNIEYNKELGVALLCRGARNDDPKSTAEGKAVLNGVLKLKPETALDRTDIADTRKLLADPSLACGYSRVQQEEVSDSSFK